MNTYFFFHTDGIIIQTSAMNPQAAYNQIVKLGLMSTTSEIVSLFVGNVTDSTIVTVGSNLKNQVEDWQFCEGDFESDFCEVDPDGERAMEQYYDTKACMRDWNTPPQYR